MHLFSLNLYKQYDFPEQGSSKTLEVLRIDVEMALNINPNNIEQEYAA